MKVAIEILSTNIEPSTSNIQGIKDTYITLANELSKNNKLKHEYDFYFYYGGYSVSTLGTAAVVEKDNEYSNCYKIKIGLEETIYNTFEKGIWALKYVNGYDWYIRTNISCYINIPLLDEVLSQFDEDVVYCNAINSFINDERYFNDLYPRGDMMIFSNKTKNGILSVSDKYIRCDVAKKNRLNIPHVDDCMFGLCFIDYFGDEYYNHLRALAYNYLPDASETIDRDISFSYIGNRVKTIPPGVTYSGYSWEDNKYRRYDIKKMEYLNKNIKRFSYKGTKLENLYSDLKKTLFIHLSNQNIDTFKVFLKTKRKN